jgi:amidase
MSLAPGAVSARALANSLSLGAVTSRQLTEAFLARIAADATVHAVCTVEAERALRSADASDARRSAGAVLGRLDGLPMTLKDAVRYAGSRTTYGLQMYRWYVPTTSAKIVAALEAQGVVILGRTTVPTGSFDWNGRNTIFADCTNPHDASRSPGGSSAGAAAAVAAGFSPLDIGSDLGGSIRVPCHFCGVAGIRTTDGWLPVDDLAPTDLKNGYERILAFGPIARDVDDLSLILDAWAAAIPSGEQPLGNGPLAVTWSLDGLHPDRRTRDAMESWLAGQNAVEATPDLDFAELFRVWGTIAGFEFSRGLPWYARNTPIRWAWGKVSVGARLGNGPLTEFFSKGMLTSEQAYQRALESLEIAQKEIARFFERYSAWVLPVCPGSAPLLALEGKAIDGESYGRWHGTYNCPTAVLGTPALSLPLPVQGLPIGVQIHGPRFSDRALVAAFSGSHAGDCNQSRQQ